MSILLTDERAARAFERARIAVAVVSAWRRPWRVRATDAAVRDADLPYAVAKRWIQNVKGMHHAVGYCPSTDAPGEEESIVPLWNILRHIPDTAPCARAPAPVLYTTEAHPGEIAVERYDMDYDRFRLWRFRFSCVLFYHKASGKIIVSDQNQPDPMGSLTAWYVDYQEGIPFEECVVEEIGYPLLTRVRLHDFVRHVCVTRDPRTRRGVKENFHILQKELRHATSAMTQDPLILARVRPERA